ncbi:hypothetical protein NDU88_003393 [Pleurodeles waltl]|uniref:Uncharacterized protein n=1 Tax=Pleurodeles waltl TaxID=8319 RepID=A0AAV7UYS7_PLEWA|nr:hypothetical protein NDU88_003393 [Pleurodeles waltl]
MSSAKGLKLADLPHATASPAEEATMDRILQEITDVECRLEGMDSVIPSLAAETKSIRLDIAGFQIRVLGLEQRLVIVEDHLNTTPDRDQELLCPRSKLIDLEDRSNRENFSFFGFPEQIEGTDIQTFLRTTLPTLMSLTFEPPLEFQRVHQLGPK